MPSAIWKRIETAIGHKGWTMADLAREAACSRQGVYSIKSGQSQGGKIFGQIAKALEVDPEWLRSGDAAVCPDWYRPVPVRPRDEGKPFEFRRTQEVVSEPVYDHFQQTVIDHLRAHTIMLKAIFDHLGLEDHDETVRAALATRVPPVGSRRQRSPTPA